MASFWAPVRSWRDLYCFPFYLNGFRAVRALLVWRAFRPCRPLGTRFVLVGLVLGSRDSAIPRWRGGIPRGSMGFPRIARHSALPFWLGGIPPDSMKFRPPTLAWRACAGVSLPGRAMLRLQAKPLWKTGLGSAPKEHSYRKYRARRARVPACHSQGGRRSGFKPSPYGKKVSEAHSKNSPIVSTARRARVWRRVTPMAGDAPGLKHIRKPICYVIEGDVRDVNKS